MLGGERWVCGGGSMRRSRRMGVLGVERLVQWGIYICSLKWPPPPQHAFFGANVPGVSCRPQQNKARQWYNSGRGDDTAFALCMAFARVMTSDFGFMVATRTCRYIVPMISGTRNIRYGARELLDTGKRRADMTWKGS